MGRREELGLAVVRRLVERPRLGDVVFRLDRWGNIFGADRFVDPYPVYERMRGSGPVSFSPLLQQWAVVGYEEARQVLSSPSFGVAAQVEALLSARPYAHLSDEAKALFRNALLFTDPPRHTRLRAAISRAFTPRRMAALEPRIGELASRLVADLASHQTPELVGGFTEPLPVQVIGELIGLPEDRWGWLAGVSATLRTMLDVVTVVDPEVVDATVGEITGYFTDLAAERAARPQDDLLTVLAQSVSEGQLGQPELVSLVTILLLAGHETSSGALGNAIVALARHPEQRQLVRDRPELWPDAVEELLRFDPVVQTDPRAAFEDVTIAGRRIKAGQNLTVMLGGVNRDPRTFDAPHELRLDRRGPPTLAFGHGIHHCIGAALVRAEMRIALPVLLDALGDHEVVEDQLEWKRSIAFRGPSRLRVRRG